VPAAKTRAREEALAELARRYFYSRGPATLADFGWWSGLAAADARAALEMIQPELHPETLSDQVYWWPPPAVPAPDQAPSPAAYLLAGFEEYILGYKDRSASLDSPQSQQAVLRTGVIHPVMVLQGRVVGTWKRTFKKDALVVETRALQPLNETNKEAFAAAASRYAQFLGKKISCS
jgi:Winged helix DNA-binding domain